MPNTPLGKLRRARLRAQRQIAKLEPMLAGYKAKLATVEAQIVAMDALLFLPRAPVRRNPYFATGELPRLALQIMRETDGPVTVRFLAIRALAMNGCTAPTPGVMKQTRKRLSMALTAWGKRGVTVRLGSWNDSRHVLRRD